MSKEQKTALQKELVILKKDIRWLKQYPMDDGDWQKSPAAVIEKRTKMIQREREIIIALRTDAKNPQIPFVQ